jgi:tetratricopeptide (TPR) repeat protein
METLASGGSIYLTAATAQLIRTFFELEDLGEFEVKGAAEAVQVFELQGVGSSRTRFDLSRARGLTRFVGRGNETTLLETSLEQGLAGSARTVGVVAQAGTGKSRLCYEFLESCRARGITVFEARGLSHGMNIPLLPMLEMLRDFFGIQERDSDRVAREKVAGRALLLDDSLQEELPIFFDLLGVPDPARPLPDLDPDALQRRMYSAVRKIVRADNELDPGVLLVEDLHWLDPASDEMLEHLVEAFAESKGLLLVNFRPEYRARWMLQSHYQQLSLLPLSEDALGEVLADLLGSDPSVARLPAAIHTRTGGNPFYIEEFVQSLVENGHLRGTRGNYQLATDFESLPMPQSVKALLASRIDRLLEREKQVLQAASVIGKTFPESILLRVVDLPEADMADALRRLQDGEFLFETALYPEREFSFKHPLTQEVAEASQLESRRAEAHAAVGQAYEMLFPEHLDERAAVLAHHWEAAGQPRRAAGWNARAADHIRTKNYQGAADHWRKVDALLPDVDLDEEFGALKARALQELMLLGFRTGLDLDEAKQILERARVAHAGRGNERDWAFCLNAYSIIAQTSGHILEYRELCIEAVDIAKRLEDEELLAVLGLDWMYSLFVTGLLAEALAAGDEIIRLANGDTELGAARAGYSPLTLSMAFSATALADLGRIDEAQSRIDTAARLVDDRDNAESSTWFAAQTTAIYMARGDWEEALRSARSAVASAERSGSAFDPVLSHAFLATVQSEAGQHREAIRSLDTAIKLGASRIGLEQIMLASWVVPAELLDRGDVAEARTSVNQCIEELREQSCLVSLARAHLVSAAIHRADSQSSEADADADLNIAEELIERTGARRLQGLLFEARGQHGEALQIYEEIGATGHAARMRGDMRRGEFGPWS